MSVYTQLTETIASRRAAFLLLLDPDKVNESTLNDFIPYAEQCGVDGFLVGGSLLMTGNFDSVLAGIKKAATKPVIIFPGSVNQVSGNADAILFLSLVSGRNPEHLIGKQVMAAPLIRQAGLEAIATAYMLIESGNKTTAEYISGTIPIPSGKPDIAAATALAAEYLGMKFIYLEAGSGAERTVPVAMVKAVSSWVTVPVIAGGGIRTPQAAADLVNAGARLIVTGNHFEIESNRAMLREFADAVHGVASV